MRHKLLTILTKSNVFKLKLNMLNKVELYILNIAPIKDAIIVDAKIAFLSIFNSFIIWYTKGTNKSSIIASLTNNAANPNKIDDIPTSNDNLKTIQE